MPDVPIAVFLSEFILIWLVHQQGSMFRGPKEYQQVPSSPSFHIVRVEMFDVRLASTQTRLRDVRKHEIMM